MTKTVFRNVRIGGALVTIEVPLKTCRKCKLAKEQFEFEGYQTCGDCRAAAYAYQQERKRIREEQRAKEEAERAEREKRASEILEYREHYWELSVPLAPNDDEYSYFHDWACYYNDEVEGTGKYLSVIFEDFDDLHFDMKLWYELLVIWNDLGRPKAPEGWEPK